MITFPNAKINLGLHVTEKRSDGFHNLETVFYPVGFSDILEIRVMDYEKRGVMFSASGIPVPCDDMENLCIRALRMIEKKYDVPAMEMHLHKAIPAGAGLGGGSSDASFVIRMLNDMLHLGMSLPEMLDLSAALGSDCPFFIHNRPLYATGKGNVFEEISLSLCGKGLCIIAPPVHVSTAAAYSGVRPRKPQHDLKEVIASGVHEWRHHLTNDFEEGVFTMYPELAVIKETLYGSGAVYASMSGSGSALYGIFEEIPDMVSMFPHCKVWQGSCSI
jgi:4-diphosphocytidyl-2-C-methyl-D-erythritol kinase